MNLIHNTLIHENSIQNCLALELRSQGILDVIIFYKNRAIVASILITEKQISFQNHQTFFLEVPLLWVETLGNNY